MLGINPTLFNGTLHKALRQRISVPLWAEHFNGSVFIKKCTGRTAPNRLEAHGVNRGSTEVRRPLMVVIIVVLSERGAAGEKIIGGWG